MAVRCGALVMSIVYGLLCALALGLGLVWLRRGGSGVARRSARVFDGAEPLVPWDHRLAASFREGMGCSDAEGPAALLAHVRKHRERLLASGAPVRSAFAAMDALDVRAAGALRELARSADARLPRHELEFLVREHEYTRALELLVVVGPAPAEAEAFWTLAAKLGRALGLSRPFAVGLWEARAVRAGHVVAEITPELGFSAGAELRWSPGDAPLAGGGHRLVLRPESEEGVKPFVEGEVREARFLLDEDVWAHVRAGDRFVVHGASKGRRSARLATGVVRAVRAPAR